MKEQNLFHCFFLLASDIFITTSVYKRSSFSCKFSLSLTKINPKFPIHHEIVQECRGKGSQIIYFCNRWNYIVSCRVSPEKGKYWIGSQVPEMTWTWWEGTKVPTL